ncbi:hypothetical protein [Paenibacillus sp. CMAA1364]
MSVDQQTNDAAWRLGVTWVCGESPHLDSPAGTSTGSFHLGSELPESGPFASKRR